MKLHKSTKQAIDAMDINKSTKETIKEMEINMSKTRRFKAWVVHALLSMIVMCAIIDGFPSSERGRQEKFALGTGATSFALSFIIAIAHYVKPVKQYLTDGALAEFLCCISLLSLWGGGLIVILNPANEIASFIEPSMGTELIKDGNLYFSTWACFISISSIFVSFFHKFEFNPTIKAWTFLLTTSILMLGSAAHLREGICDINDGRRCHRTNYAITVGFIVGLLSTVALLIARFSKLTPVHTLFISLPCAGFAAFGVVVITSASGPGKSLGTLYFTTWSIAVLSFWTALNAFNERFREVEEVKKESIKRLIKSKREAEKESEKSTTEVEKGGDDPIMKSRAGQYTTDEIEI